MGPESILVGATHRGTSRNLVARDKDFEGDPLNQWFPKWAIPPPWGR